MSNQYALLSTNSHQPVVQLAACHLYALPNMASVHQPEMAACCRATQGGGAIYDQNTQATATVANSTFASNTAATGANVAIRNGNTKLRENIGNPDSSVAVISLDDSSTGTAGSAGDAAEMSDYFG